MEAYYLEMLMMYSSEFKPANKIVSEMLVKQNYVDYIYSDQFLIEFDKAYEEVLRTRNGLAENLYEIMNKMDQTKILVDLNDNKNVLAQLARLIGILQGKVTSVEQEIDESKKQLLGVEERKDYIISRLPELEKISEGIVKEALPRVYTKIGKAVSDRQNTIDHLKNQIVTLEENLKGVQGSFILFGKKVKIEELEEKIKKANSALKSETRKQEIENRVFNIPQSGNNDEFVIDWFRQVMKHVPDVQDEVRLCENTRSEFYKLSKESESIDESIAVAKVKYEATKAKDYSEEIKSSITQLKERAEQYNLLGTYQKIFDLATASYRKENDIRTIRGKCHRYDLYAQLIFAIKFFGMTYGNTKFMCVDEAQDLALNEYKLLKKLNSNNLVFNLYGDVNQLIKPNRGVTDWSEIEKILPSKEFVLNENYRNTNQITRFCNSSFNMDVLQTGVDGAQVREISRSELEGELEMLNITTERLAILVPRTVQKGKYLKKELLSEQKKSIIDDSLDNGHISLMYVDEVKGIEFDKVYVIANKMARNEKYIAYTRALSELIIVVDENVPDQKDEDLNDVDEAE